MVKEWMDNIQIYDSSPKKCLNIDLHIFFHLLPSLDTVWGGGGGGQEIL